MTDENGTEPIGWAILELMGHRRLGGYVTEQVVAGQGMIRIDVPSAEGDVTQFYSPSALYCVTPTTEDVARAVAVRLRPAPVSRYELTPPTPAAERTCRVCDERPCIDGCPGEVDADIVDEDPF